MSEIQVFHDELMADVVAEAQLGGDGGDHSSAFKETAFTRILLSDLESAGVLESPVECYFASTSGRIPYKVNGYSIPEDEARLDLVITDFHPEPKVQRIVAADVDRCLKQLQRFLSVAIERGPELADSGHPEYSMLRELHERRDLFERVQLILVTNAAVVQRKEKARREQVGRYQLGYEVWDLERLRRFRSSGATHEPVMIDFSSMEGGGIRCVPVEDRSLGYKTCVAIFPGETLFDLYEEHGARLLELNVRSYLQAKGNINKGILETLLTNPQQFLAYNNGITVVGERIDIDKSGTLITGIHGLQIVNGGQTTASIHRARKEHQADLTHVFVQAKITEVPQELFDTIVPEISRLSNTQNKVSIVDLGANHPFHVGVERVSHRTWAPGEQSMWFYERARGAYQTERVRSGTTAAKRAAFDRKYPVGQRVTKEDLARYGNAWDRLPHTVSKGGQKNFGHFMTAIGRRDKGWEPTQDEFKTIIGKAILFRCAQECAKSLRIRSYGINIVTYTVALLAERTAGRVNLKALWDRQGLTPALEAQIRAWLPMVGKHIVGSAGDRNVGEWFKSEGCWLHLRQSAKDWVLDADLARELLPVGDGATVLPIDVQNNIVRCMQVDAQIWLKIQIWGNETNSLEFWQKGIANTLAGYAAASWPREPSTKQANHAVKILELYDEYLRQHTEE
jgi:AIPR protein